jgi:hypothetical protein
VVGVICPGCLTLREQRAIQAEKARVIRWRLRQTVRGPASARANLGCTAPLGATLSRDGEVVGVVCPARPRCKSCVLPVVVVSDAE